MVQLLLLPLLGIGQLSSIAGPITVAELIKEMSAQSGTTLRAEGETARTLVVTSFGDVSLESFKRALASVVDAEWNGDTLARPKAVADQYWGRIERARQMNEEDLRAFLRYVHGEMRAEDVPPAFISVLTMIKESCPEVALELASWSNREVESALSGECFWITQDGEIRYTLAYSRDSGQFLVADLHAKTYERTNSSFAVGKPPFSYAWNHVDPGWHRNGDWKPLDELRREQVAVQFVGGVNAADRVGGTVKMPSIGVYMPSVLTASVQGYSAYLRENGWILLRPYTYDRPGMHAVAPDVMTSERLESGAAAIDAYDRHMTAMPYLYQGLWSDPPEWRPLSSSTYSIPLLPLWKLLDPADREKLLTRRLYFSELDEGAQQAWRRAVPMFLVDASKSRQDPIAVQVTPRDILSANVRFRCDMRVVYKSIEGRSGFATSWRGLSHASGLDTSESTVLHLYDTAEIWCTVALPSGESFSQRTEISWYLGSAKFGELAARDPGEHPTLAIANRKKAS